MSNQRFGFKRSYLRKSFWRANGMIASILGLLGVLIVVIFVMSRSEAEVSDTRAAAPETARP